jgi:hypothetical protein
MGKAPADTDSAGPRHQRLRGGGLGIPVSSWLATLHAGGRAGRTRRLVSAGTDSARRDSRQSGAVRAPGSRRTPFGPRDAVEDRLVSLFKTVRARFPDRLLRRGLIYLRLPQVECASARTQALNRGPRLRDQPVRSRAARSACREALVCSSRSTDRRPDLALQYQATGSIFVAGGSREDPPAMRDRFPRLVLIEPPLGLLAGIPVLVVLEPRLPLYGAAATPTDRDGRRAVLRR